MHTPSHLQMLDKAKDYIKGEGFKLGTFYITSNQAYAASLEHVPNTCGHPRCEYNAIRTDDGEWVIQRTSSSKTYYTQL